MVDATFLPLNSSSKVLIDMFSLIEKGTLQIPFHTISFPSRSQKRSCVICIELLFQHIVLLSPM